MEVDFSNLEVVHSHYSNKQEKALKEYTMPAPEGTKQEEVIPPAISIPDGIKPLFFSGPSQQIFECVVDTHLTSDNPHKLILKAKILDDFKTRAAVCDFHPVKKQVQVRMCVFPI